MTDEAPQQEETTEEKQEDPIVDTPKGDKPKTPSIIDQADSMSKVMAHQITEMRQLLQRQEEISARRLLQGDTEAGNPSTKPKEETAKEYKDRIMGIPKI